MPVSWGVVMLGKMELGANMYSASRDKPNIAMILRSFFILWRSELTCARRGALTMVALPF